MVVFTYTDIYVDTRNPTSLAEAFLSIFSFESSSFLARITRTEPQSNWCEKAAPEPELQWPAQSRVTQSRLPRATSVGVYIFPRKEIPQPLWVTSSLGNTKDSGFTFFTPVSGIYMHWLNPSQPSLAQFEQSELCQPLLIWEMLQGLCQLCGPSLSLLQQVHVSLVLGI